MNAVITLVGLVIMGLSLVGRIIPGRIRFSNGGTVGGLLLGAVLSVMPYAVFYAEPGMSYLVQFPWGAQSSMLEPGYHTRFFGNVIPFKKYLTVRFVSGRDLESNHEQSALLEAIPVRFNDAVTADVSVTVRFELPSDAEVFRDMGLAYRSQANLVHSTLVPLVREVVRNAGRMLSAQDYIGGKGGHFENAIEDQLKNGIMLLDIVTTQSEVKADAITQDGSRTIDRRELIRYDVRVRKDADGNPVRKATSLGKYRLRIAQSTVERVEPEQRFKDTLAMQRDAAAQANVEREQAKKAEHHKQRIIAEGEAAKAGIRVAQEKAQIETLIASETLMKEQRIVVEKRKAELEGAKLEAKAIRVRAEAEATARKLKMQADGALEQRLEALVAINQAYAAALKDKQLVPTIVMGGSSGQGTNATDFVNLLMAKSARDLALDLAPKGK